ncbi:hypothetical protein DL93DRAFT_2098131 [Clavulina sp. PMI_390]|nr:hypothetical protein DL93DRAFT_2098131 [Clavulina sp. PMI_390]
MAGINSLPVELLRLIFSLALDQMPSGYAVNLAMVCWRWYKVATQHQALWSHITLNPGELCNEKLVLSRLKFSGSSVHIDFEDDMEGLLDERPSVPEGVSNIITQRLRAATISMNPENWENAYIWNMLASFPQPMDRLESLTLEHRPFTVEEYDALDSELWGMLERQFTIVPWSTPNLSFLRINAGILCMPLQMPPEKLERCELIQGQADSLQHLGPNCDVEIVELVDCIGTLVVDMEPPPITFDSLHTLLLRENHPSCVATLATSFGLPSLRKIHLDNWQSYIEGEEPVQHSDGEALSHGGLLGLLGSRAPRLEVLVLSNGLPEKLAELLNEMADTTKPSQQIRNVGTLTLYTDIYRLKDNPTLHKIQYTAIFLAVRAWSRMRADAGCRLLPKLELCRCLAPTSALSDAFAGFAKNVEVVSCPFRSLESFEDQFGFSARPKAFEWD